jgi:hypothetical protein
MEDSTHKHLAIRVARLINAIGDTETLADTMLFQGPPLFIRADDGPKRIARVLRQWLPEPGLKILKVTPCSPLDNGYCDSFNGKLGHE